MNASTSNPLSAQNHMKQAIVSLENIGFRYSNLIPPVLEDVSFMIAPRDVVAIVGKSGVGKSTLMKIIGRGLQPTAGTVVHSADVLLPGAIAYMDQTSTLFPWKKTRQLIELSLSRAPIRSKTRMTAKEALLAFGLEKAGEQYPHELSGGMKQRLALAFSVLREPALLLLDEPFGSVDEFTREGLYLLLQSILAQTITSVVMITHNISECLTLADHVVVLGARPVTTVIGTYLINGPKPRSATTLLENEFVTVNKEIREKIGGR